MFQTQILQIASEGVFFSNQKKVIIKLQGIKDTSIDSDGNRRRAFLYAVHSERRTGGTFSNLRNRKIATQSGELNLLTHKGHFLLQFPGQLSLHSVLCHCLCFKTHSG